MKKGEWKNLLFFTNYLQRVIDSRPSYEKLLGFWAWKRELVYINIYEFKFVCH